MIRAIRPDEVLEVDIDAPAAGSSPPAPPKAPASPANEACIKRAGRTRVTGALRHFVNAGRNVRRWARWADARRRAGHEYGIEPLRQATRQRQRFHATFGVNLLNAEVSAQLNPLLRRGDMEGIRRLARHFQLRDIATCALAETGAKPETPYALRN